MAGVTAHDWGCFVALDTAVRSYSMISSMVIYLGGFCWLRYGYNTSAENKGSNALSFTEDKFTFLMQQWMVSLTIEVLNLLAMELFFRWLLGRDGALFRFAWLLQSNLVLASFVASFGISACA